MLVADLVVSCWVAIHVYHTQVADAISTKFANAKILD